MPGGVPMSTTKQAHKPPGRLRSSIVARLQFPALPAYAGHPLLHRPAADSSVCRRGGGLVRAPVRGHRRPGGGAGRALGRGHAVDGRWGLHRHRRGGRARGRPAAPLAALAGGHRRQGGISTPGRSTSSPCWPSTPAEPQLYPPAPQRRQAYAITWIWSWVPWGVWPSYLMICQLVSLLSASSRTRAPSDPQTHPGLAAAARSG